MIYEDIEKLHGLYRAAFVYIVYFKGISVLKTA